MLPYIHAGLRQRAGEQVSERVKRQTIRKRGPRADKLLEWAKGASWTIPYDLHLRWQTRSPQGKLIGIVEGGCRFYPIDIWHTWCQDPGGPERPILRIDAPRGWRRGDAMIFWSELHGGLSFEEEAFADGFDSVEAFRDFFVPKMGDRFDGVIYKW